MATVSQWSHAIVACVLVALALLLPVVFVCVTLVVPAVRERRAKWRLREKRESVQETDAVVAEPHMCGGFRLAVARGKLDVVRAMTDTWERKGLPPSALHGSSAHGGESGGGGFSALHIAAVEGHVTMLEYLLRARGVHVDALHVQCMESKDRPAQGRSALHYAALNNHIACVGVLVRYGANYSMKDAFGETPIAIAFRKGYREIATLLEHIDHIATARRERTAAPSKHVVSFDVSRSISSSSNTHEHRVTAAASETSTTLSTLAALAAGGCTAVTSDTLGTTRRKVMEWEQRCVSDRGEERGAGDESISGMHTGVRRSFTQVLMDQLLMTTTALQKTIVPVVGGDETEKERKETSEDGAEDIEVALNAETEADGVQKYTAVSFSDRGTETHSSDDGDDVHNSCGPEVAPLFLYFASALSMHPNDGAGDTSRDHLQHQIAASIGDMPMLSDNEIADYSIGDEKRRECASDCARHRQCAMERHNDENGGGKVKTLIAGGYDGYGSRGTSLLRGSTAFRIVGLLCEIVGAAYIVWRPLRSLSPPLNPKSAAPVPEISQSPYVLIYAAIFYLSELVLFLPSILFVFVELWRPMTRTPVRISEIADACAEADATILRERCYKHERGRITSRVCTSKYDNGDEATDAFTPTHADDHYPTVDVVITCYNEPVDIVEGTLCAALSLRYPISKMSVYLLDDGGRAEIEAMVDRVRRQARALHLCSSLRYVSRVKDAAVPHHAKAGNINNCLLCEGMRGDFLVVYDSDMVAKPDFLEMTLGHFYEKEEGVACLERATKKAFALGSAKRNRVCDLESGQADGGCDLNLGSSLPLSSATASPEKALPMHKENIRSRQCRHYRLKSRTAFVQVPQDFYNVPWNDPLGHAARFFYGPMMQGRDGMNATPCVGTGVIFNRHALLSIGGQSYGSVTEDYKTCMILQHAGFSTVYLNDRLVYGLAPDDIAGTMRQRLRWATGSLQIMFQDSPLCKPGLSWAQRAVLFQSQFQYVVALPLLSIIVGPLLYMYFGITPISLENGIEFLALFVTYYWLNRWMIFLAARCGDVDSLELWRGSQQYIYMVPNHMIAIVNVIVAAVFTKRDIAFAVTEKRKKRHAKDVTAKRHGTHDDATEVHVDVIEKQGKKSKDNGVTRKSRGRMESARTPTQQIWADFRAQLVAALPFLLYYLLAIGGVIYNAVRFANDELNLTEGGAVLIAFAWSLLTMLYMWPVVGSFLSSTLGCGSCLQRVFGMSSVNGTLRSASNNGGGVEWKAVHRSPRHGSFAQTKSRTIKGKPSSMSSGCTRPSAATRIDVLRRQTLRSVVNAGFDVVRAHESSIGRRATNEKRRQHRDYDMMDDNGDGAHVEDVDVCDDDMDGGENRDPTAVAFATSNRLMKTPSLNLSLRKSAVARSRSSAHVLPLNESDQNTHGAAANHTQTFGRSRSVGNNRATYSVVENSLYGWVAAKSRSTSMHEGAERNDANCSSFTTYNNAAYFLNESYEDGDDGNSNTGAQSHRRLSLDQKQEEDGTSMTSWAPSAAVHAARTHSLSTTTTAALDVTAGGVFGGILASGRTWGSSDTARVSSTGAALAAASIATEYASSERNNNNSFSSPSLKMLAHSPRTASTKKGSRAGRSADEVPAPSIVLPTRPRFSISMYLFFIVNGLLFLFFVGGGIAFIVLEQTENNKTA